MFYTFQDAVHTLWRWWSGLFEPLPYGDPYLAVATMAVVIVVSAKLFFGREPS
jgi:hypothetical protein